MTTLTLKFHEEPSPADKIVIEAALGKEFPRADFASGDTLEVNYTLETNIKLPNIIVLERFSKFCNILPVYEELVEHERQIKIARRKIRSWLPWRTKVRLILKSTLLFRLLQIRASNTFDRRPDLFRLFDSNQ